MGLLGTLSFAWLVLRSVRGQLHLARSDPGLGGYLPLACAAAVAGYAVGMFTYDAFSFTQTTFVFFVILGLGASYQLAVAPAPGAVRSVCRSSPRRYTRSGCPTSTGGDRRRKRNGR